MTSDIDYALAFDLAPIGLVLSRNRTIVDCNQRMSDLFGAARDQLVGQSFRVLYPSADEYERTGARIAPLLGRNGTYADEDLSARRPVKAELTPREREVAAYLMAGLTAKETGKALAISHRTVEIHRARLMRKYKASTATDLVHKLIDGG